MTNRLCTVFSAERWVHPTFFAPTPIRMCRLPPQGRVSHTLRFVQRFVSRLSSKLCTHNLWRRPSAAFVYCNFEWAWCAVAIAVMRVPRVLRLKWNGVPWCRKRRSKKAARFLPYVCPRGCYSHSIHKVVYMRFQHAILPGC